MAVSPSSRGRRAPAALATERPAPSADRPATGGPAGLEDHLGFWLRFVSNQVSLGFQQRLVAQGVSVTDWVALRSLWPLAAGAPQTALGQVLGLTKGATSKVVTRLEGRGLVQRLPAAAAGRERVVALTPAGRQLVPRLAALADENDAHFFGHLPPAARQALRQTLEGLVAHHGLTQTPLD